MMGLWSWLKQEPKLLVNPQNLLWSWELTEQLGEVGREMPHMMSLSVEGQAEEIDPEDSSSREQPMRLVYTLAEHTEFTWNQKTWEKKLIQVTDFPRAE